MNSLSETSYILVLIGTDGSGKSTLARRLVDDLGRNAVYLYYGMKEFRFSLADRMYSRSCDKGLLFRYLVMPIEYSLRRRSISNGVITVLDRIPGWAFTGSSGVLRTIYQSVLPSADLLVLCTGEASVIVDRKPERTQSECEADLSKWRRVHESFGANRRLVLDTTSHTVEESMATLRACLEADPRFAEMGAAFEATG